MMILPKMNNKEHDGINTNGLGMGREEEKKVLKTTVYKKKNWKKKQRKKKITGKMRK